MVAAAELDGSESVLEIGTGRGVLTEMLAGACSSLLGYEVDPANYRETLARVKGRNVSVRLADAFKERPRFDVLVASLPYSRSLDFVEWISQVEYLRGVVLLQEDFVRKVLSPPGSRDYRAVSAICQVSSTIRVLERVGRSAFRPQPRVSSVIVSVKPKVRLTRAQVLSVKRLFSLRRREVSSALALLGFPDRRGYGRLRVMSLSPQEVFEICSGGLPA